LQHFGALLDADDSSVWADTFLKKREAQASAAASIYNYLTIRQPKPRNIPAPILLRPKQKTARVSVSVSLVFS